MPNRDYSEISPEGDGAVNKVGGSAMKSYGPSKTVPNDQEKFNNPGQSVSHPMDKPPSKLPGVSGKE